MKHTFASFVILLLSTFIIISCKKNMPETPKVNRSVLVYVAANNNLNLHAASNLSDLISNYSESAMNGGNLIVYYNVKNNNAKLLQICNNTEAKVIKEYPTPHNAADPATLKAVIGDFKQLFPADNYGCIFWSHASAWLPKTFFNDATQKATQFSLPKPSETADLINHPLYKYIRHIEQPAQTKMFAQDGNNFMELEELEDAMKTNEFDFVIFDACYMGSIEVAYSMRNKSKWMLASPTEVLGNGIQYKTLANHLFSLSTDYTQMLKSIADDYAKKYNESTMAIYDLSKVDKFTSEYKALMANINNKVGSSTPYNVQRYDRYDDHVLFDMVDYVSTISNGRETANIQRIIDQVVVYKYSTPMFMLIPMTHYSGVSTYIPFESYIHVTPFYKGLRWYNNVLK